MRSKPN